MAFIIVGGNVVSYAEAADVKDKDQRVFEANEIEFTNAPDNPANLNEYIEDLTTKATGRINEKIRTDVRWREYLNWTGQGYNINYVPAFNPNYILSRQADFTDLCAYGALYMYILPKVADFGNPESPEVMKITFYEQRFNDLFNELMSNINYYDIDNSGAIDDSEKAVSFPLARRTRGGRRNIGYVR